MITTLLQWLLNPRVQVALVVFSVLTLLVSLVLVPRFLATLPADYLQQSMRPPPERHPVLHFLLNALAVVLVLLGVLLLVLPGPGLLVMLVGLLLLDFPRKRHVIRRLLSRAEVLTLVNKLRARHGSPPLQH